MIKNYCLNVGEAIAEYSPNPVFRKYGDNILDLVQEAPKDLLVCGAADEEFSTEAIGIPMDGKQFNACILGQKGSGKTNLLMLLVNQLYWRYGLPCALFDPKWELFTHLQKNSHFEERLLDFGLTPRALPSVIATPSPAARDFNHARNGYVYRLNLNDFKRIDNASELFNTLINFFNVGDSVPAKNSLIRWIVKLPNDFEEFVELLAHESKKIVEGSNISRQGGSSLLNSLQSMRLGKSIGKGNGLYAPSVMLSGDSRRAVIFQLSLDGAADHILSNYVKMALVDIRRDRSNFLANGKGFLSKSPVMAFDEVDLFCPINHNPVCKSVIENFYTKLRYLSIFNIVATQKPAYLSDKLVENSDYLFTTKLNSKADRDVFKYRCLADEDINNLMLGLKFERSDPVKEFGLVLPDASVEYLFPLPSPSRMFEEQRSF